MTGRIIIADDHPMFREGMLRTVQRLLPEAVVQEAGDIDTLILDLRVPGLTCLSQLADGGGGLAGSGGGQVFGWVEGLWMIGPVPHLHQRKAQ